MVFIEFEAAPGLKSTSSAYLEIWSVLIPSAAITVDSMATNRTNAHRILKMAIIQAKKSNPASPLDQIRNHTSTSSAFDAAVITIHMIIVGHHLPGIDSSSAMTTAVPDVVGTTTGPRIA